MRSPDDIGQSQTSAPFGPTWAMPRLDIYISNLYDCHIVSCVFVCMFTRSNYAREGTGWCNDCTVPLPHQLVQLLVYLFPTPPLPIICIPTIDLDRLHVPESTTRPSGWCSTYSKPLSPRPASSQQPEIVLTAPVSYSLSVCVQDTYTRHHAHRHTHTAVICERYFGEPAQSPAYLWLA